MRKCVGINTKAFRKLLSHMPKTSDLYLSPPEGDYLSNINIHINRNYAGEFSIWIRKFEASIGGGIISRKSLLFVEIEDVITFLRKNKIKKIKMPNEGDLI